MCYLFDCMRDKEIIIPVSKIKSKTDHESLVHKLKKEAAMELDELDSRSHTVDKGMHVVTEGKIALKFSKFIQLVATHDFEEMLDKHKMEEVIISSDLLVDLAGSTPVVDEVPESRFSWLFLGLMIGLVCASIVFLVFLS